VVFRLSADRENSAKTDADDRLRARRHSREEKDHGRRREDGPPRPRKNHTGAGSSERRSPCLSFGAPPPSAWPALDDVAGWKRQIAATDAMIMQRFVPRNVVPCAITERREGGVLAYELIPEGVNPADRRLFYDIHGGALIMSGGETCKARAQARATTIGARLVAVDYRMPPDHPYPASLDDCLLFYRALLNDRDPAEIIVGGGSAGGNLAAAMLLRARDEGLPMPAAVVLLSPELDLTESGDSFFTNAGIDGMGSLMLPNLLYAGGADLADPYLSPLFGDFTKGFPPTLLTSGTRDLFLSNTVRMHRALREAGIEAELHVLEAAAHGNFGGNSPEEAAMNREVRRFCDARWAAGRRR
jgi:acetyl esterase/lipase